MLWQQCREQEKIARYEEEVDRRRSEIMSGVEENEEVEDRPGVWQGFEVGIRTGGLPVIAHLLISVTI